MTCLITGCALIDPDGAAIWGDLYQLADCYVFNAVLRNGEASRSYELRPDGRIITIVGDFFERRGVFVIPLTCAVLNQVASLFIAEGAKHGY